MAGGGAAGASPVRRAFDLLGCFDADHRRLGLTELSRRSGLPLATAHRLVGQLVEERVLDRDPDGLYVVGRRVWDLGLLAPTETDLRETASPYLQDLHAATRATVHLAVREDDHALYLDRLSGGVSVPVVSRIGSRLPLHATGVGKVLLAHAPRATVDRVLADLHPVTAYTVTAPGLLREQLDRARQQGYATTREEMTLGACSVAVPVRVGDEVVAAMGIVVRDFRRDRSRLVTALVVAASGAGRSFARARDRDRG